MRITLNAPFILLFTFVATGLFILGLLFDGPFRIAILHGDFQYTNWEFYPSLFLYPLSHGSITHLTSNFALILLLGPILERKYGWKKLAIMTLLTALVTGITHIIISDAALIGASGIAFMFIVLASLMDSTGKEIPLTFILVAILFLGQEVLGTLKEDNISQYAHIAGGILGIVFRYSSKL